MLSAEKLQASNSSRLEAIRGGLLTYEEGVKNGLLFSTTLNSKEAECAECMYRFRDAIGKTCLIFIHRMLWII